MTFEKYKEWLDDQIDDNDRRMEESDDEMGSYYLGCATAFTVAKEKFIAINLVSPSPAPTVEGENEGELTFLLKYIATVLERDFDRQGIIDLIRKKLAEYAPTETATPPLYDIAEYGKRLEQGGEVDILEGNKLIAEFMGFYITPFNGSYHFVCKEEKKPKHLNQAWEFRLEEAEYHSSWDWLHPVVEKIECEHGKLFKIEGFTCEVTAAANENPRELPLRISHHKKTKQAAVYAAIVQFIKWYNLQK